MRGTLAAPDACVGNRSTGSFVGSVEGGTRGKPDLFMHRTFFDLEVPRRAAAAAACALR